MPPVLPPPKLEAVAVPPVPPLVKLEAVPPVLGCLPSQAFVVFPHPEIDDIAMAVKKMPVRSNIVLLNHASSN